MEVKKEFWSEKLQQQISTLETTKPFPASLRINIFKLLITEDKETWPSLIRSQHINAMLSHDIDHVKHCLKKWNNQEVALSIIDKINIFFEKNDLHVHDLNFLDHSYYCFCLSAFMSGIEEKDFELEYNKQIHTMVNHVVHPEGPWSLKTEFENQEYATYICHVSETGLTTIKQINETTSFRIDQDSPFVGIRLAAVACGEHPSFDGVETMEIDGIVRAPRSLETLKHDLIHAGFLKRHFQKDPINFKERFALIGAVYEAISQNENLESKLRNKVDLVWFLFMHEFTTSLFVDGIPERLPRQHKSLYGMYASWPQMMLRFGTKVGYVPTLFKNEVDIELGMCKSLKLLDDLPPDASDHDKVKRMMQICDEGYEHLNQVFSEMYNLSNPFWGASIVKRDCTLF